MSRSLLLTVTAALAAGAGAAVGAGADEPDEPPRPKAPHVVRLADPGAPPTRAEAIERAAALRDRAEKRLAEELGKSAEEVRVASRKVVGEQLDRQVRDELLTAGQRDAVLACFDDPRGCERGKLPAHPVHGPPLRGHTVAVAPSRAMPRPRRVPPPSVRRLLRPARVDRIDQRFAELLGVEAADVRKALRAVAREERRRGYEMDPDGVPFGLVPGPFAVAVPALPAIPPVAPASAPAPRPPRTPRTP